MSSESNLPVLERKDISWKYFSIAYLGCVFTNFLFDEMLRPMRGIETIELVLWYLSYPIAFFLIPGALVTIFHFGLKWKASAPRKTILVWAVAIMVFSLSMTARRLVFP